MNQLSPQTREHDAVDLVTEDEPTWTVVQVNKDRTLAVISDGDRQYMATLELSKGLDAPDSPDFDVLPAEPGEMDTTQPDELSELEVENEVVRTRDIVLGSAAAAGPDPRLEH